MVEFDYFWWSKYGHSQSEEVNKGVNVQEETVTISKKVYDQLLDSQIFLDCLESMGVDNWSGYDEAVKEYRQQVNEVME